MNARAANMFKMAKNWSGEALPFSLRGEIAHTVCKLVKKLLDAHEEQNVDAFTESVKEYDTISRLDQWLTTMLLRIKKTIQGEESDLR
ncbi:alpha-soluble NSF attachment protein-like isoform X2 [Polyodon spathula]|nr:alpha-soluble NSF attachment protein-like isoform X2 [Polyodon spathula]